MVRTETSPEDLAGMAVAQGILPAAVTSHAAGCPWYGKMLCIGCRCYQGGFHKTAEVGDIILKER